MEKAGVCYVYIWSKPPSVPRKNTYMCLNLISCGLFANTHCELWQASKYLAPSQRSGNAWTGILLHSAYY
jgi:hypothetical protein